MMKNTLKSILAAAAALCAVAAYGQKTSGNPIFEGRYADPEGVVFGDTYWIYPTYSAPFDDQLFFDAFSSKDLVKWTKHERIIDSTRIKWLRRALWAPAAIEKDGRYYLFFGANDVHEGEIGGIGVAVADSPAGPFEDYLGEPLIGEIINGASSARSSTARSPSTSLSSRTRTARSTCTTGAGATAMSPSCATTCAASYPSTTGRSSRR